MNMLILLGVAIAINIVMFLVAFKRQTDQLTDASYALTFILLALMGLASSRQDSGHIILTVMIYTWAIRLVGFLLFRIHKTGKDSRFDNMRSNFWEFGKFWLLQGITVWIILLGASLVYQQQATQLSALTIAGFGVWIIGIIIEGVADVQKYTFTSQTKNAGKWIDQGLWHLSRHPNYFGEILTWLGVYLFAIPYLHNWQLWIAAVSPLYIFVLLRFVSGVPILEKSADKRWGDQASYRAYKKRTGLIVPLRRRS